MNAENILNNLNVVVEKLFKSIENQVYQILDEIMVISPKILKVEPLKNICKNEDINVIILVANSLIIFYTIYFAFTQVLNLYNGNNVENVYKFIIKNVIIGIIVNSSYYICEEILNLFNIFTNVVDEIIEEFCSQRATFENLKETIVNIDDLLESDALSLNGMIKGMISFGAVSVLINFSIRYVTIIFVIIISPFAFVSLSSNLTSGIFTSWGKILIVNMFIQIIVKFIIFIPLIYKEVNSMLYKIILVGSIYLIYKVNIFTKEFFVKIVGNTNFGNLFKGV